MKKSFVFYAVLMLAAVLYVNTVRASLAGSIGCASGRLVEISDEALRRIDDLFARRIKAIGDTPNGDEGSELIDTLPKKPKSPLQRYRLLRKGKDVLA